MGIESDQVVYEYLSRVGDVAQQRQLPSAARMRLVAELRDEIDKRRAKAVVDSPAAVRRIIARMGTPTEVVAAAEDSPGAAPGASEQSAAVPVQREPERGAKAGGATSGDAKPGGATSGGGRGGGGRGGGVLRRVVPRPRPSAPPAAPADVPSPPHRAGSHELGDSAAQPDWWRVDSSPFGAGDEVPGFVGGVEIPELLKPPPSAREKSAAEAAPAEPGAPAAAADGAEAVPAVRRRRLLRLPSGRWSNPLLLVAAASLVVGAVLGNWFALILGWLIAYASRRLTRAEVKAAVVVLPGLALVGGIVWIWGRTAGRWGEPIAEGQMNGALAETWPWVIRTAAVASALFLLWRSQRER